MNRKEFLKNLRKNLSFLTKKALEEEVLYYINEIDKSNLSDEEIIKNFGSLEEIKRNVCEKHGLNYKILEPKPKIKWFRNFFDDLVNLSTEFKKSDGKKRAKLLLDLVLLIGFTCVLKIPFIFIRNIGDQMIDTFFSSNLNMLSIWGLLVEIFFVIIALSFFIKTLRKWFKNIEKEEK